MAEVFAIPPKALPAPPRDLPILVPVVAATPPARRIVAANPVMSAEIVVFRSAFAAMLQSLHKTKEIFNLRFSFVLLSGPAWTRNFFWVFSFVTA
jgi:hypothetical protein